MTPSVASELASAVHHWLAFQALCERSEIFSEGYLSQPVAEFLAARYRGHLATEYVHPCFRSQRGRPRQIDFALLRPTVRDLEAAIECKWIADRQPSKQAIVDDLLRLECMLTGTVDIGRYFLLAGRSASLNTHFWPLLCKHANTTSSFVDYFFGTTPGATKAVLVQSAPPEVERYFESFSIDFGVPLPTRFRTKLIARLDANDITVCLWRVQSSGRRKTFTLVQADA